MTKRFLHGVSAHAVGHGIIASMQAATRSGETERAWVEFCIGAADEARAEAQQGDANYPDVMTWIVNKMKAMKRGDIYEVDGLEHNTWEEYEQWLKQQGGHADAALAAKTAFRCCMPPLTGRGRAKAYIACVAAGVAHGHITGPEARAMLYSAQLALSVHPKRASQPRQVRRSAGFTPPPTPTPTPTASSGAKRSSK